MAALNIGGGASIFFGLLSALAVVCLVKADQLGLTPVPLIPITDEGMLSSTLLNLGIVAIVMRRSIQQLRASQVELGESKQRQEVYGRRLEKLHTQTWERARFARTISDIAESVIDSEFDEWRPRTVRSIHELFDAVAVGLYQTSSGSDSHLADWVGEKGWDTESAWTGFKQVGATLEGDPFAYVTRQKCGEPFAGLPAEANTALIVSIPGRTHPQGTLIVVLGQNLEISPGLAKDIQTLRSIVGSSMERAAAEQKMRIAQRMETVGRLAGSIAHDFNNLLTTIMGCSQLLIDEADKSENDVELLSDIVRAADHAALLTRKLLVLSRKQVVLVSPVDLIQATRDFCRMADRMVGENIEIEFIPLEGEAFVLADPSNIEQILLNLTVNARDAMPDGGKITISLNRCRADDPRLAGSRLAELENFLEMTFADTGFGMSAHVLAHVFEPFFTTKKTGTGLGLASIRAVLEGAGGSIQVSSTQDSGTVFSIFIPEDKTTTVKMNEQDKFEQWPGSGENILLVDDNDHVRRTLKQVLLGAGYRVSVAHGAEDALAVLDKSEAGFDLILTDIIMPHVSGIELANRVRGKGDSTPILFMSGFADSAQKEIGVIGDFIAKPFTSVTLLGRIGGILRENASRQLDRSMHSIPQRVAAGSPTQTPS